MCAANEGQARSHQATSGASTSLCLLRVLMCVSPHLHGPWRPRQPAPESGFVLLEDLQRLRRDVRACTQMTRQYNSEDEDAADSDAHSDGQDDKALSEHSSDDTSGAGGVRRTRKAKVRARCVPSYQMSAPR